MTVNERIKFLVEELEKDNQRQFALKIGISPTGLSSMLPGNRESSPSYDVLNKILSTYPHVSAVWLVTGKGKPFKNAMVQVGENQAAEDLGTYKLKSQMPAVVTVDSEGRDNVALVNIRARAGYLMGYADPEFIATLPTYRLPGVDNGTFRMWEVEGSSMNPTLHHRDIAITEWVESPDHMRDERIYVIVTHTEGVVIKRCINRLNKYGYIIAKSDNPNKFDYRNLEIKEEDIKEIWYPRLYISGNFSAPSDLYNRMTNLEVEMHQLRNMLA